MTNSTATLIAASAIGRSHRRCGRGSQDSWAAARAGDAVIAAVTDGCSAGRRSEVGAGVGARFVVASAARRVRDGVILADLPAVVLADLTEELRRLAVGLALDDSAAEEQAVVAEHLLFTVQVAVVVLDEAVVFGVGDGLVSVDGVVIDIDQGGAPDYPAYALVPDVTTAPRLLVHHLGRFTSTVAVATDGARELIAAEAVPLADGAPLGGLRALEDDERFARNPSLAQKRFHAWCAQGGPEDDCTVVVVRRPA